MFITMDSLSDYNSSKIGNKIINMYLKELKYNINMDSNRIIFLSFNNDDFNYTLKNNCKQLFYLIKESKIPIIYVEFSSKVISDFLFDFFKENLEGYVLLNTKEFAEFTKIFCTMNPGMFYTS